MRSTRRVRWTWPVAAVRGTRASQAPLSDVQVGGVVDVAVVDSARRIDQLQVEIVHQCLPCGHCCGRIRVGHGHAEFRFLVGNGELILDGLAIE